ncbi:glycosyltransferase family 4 protein [Acinetobacter chinensis]|uniref:Glycosyltransferase family 4 protein n=1 Tax=Acinetobacter chinensis TaxID=2004650 RepID=A0ABU3WK24_9GAMM|nr:glycosyltransferase family 4 protein [Acinetobacter chinensis]MDV2470202.1 glycosyltransferase family 4 protein [Acinetobacter chinensis]
MSQQKTIWMINQYASTPDTGFIGRHYYLAEELSRLGYQVYVIAASYAHSQSNPVSFEEDYRIDQFNENFKFVWLKVPSYEKSTSKRRVLNWFEFAYKIISLNKIIPHKPDVILYSSLSLVGFLGAERLAQKNKVPLFFEVRDIWPLSLIEIGGVSPSHPFVRFLQWVEDRAYKKADKVISNLKNSIEHMVSRGMDATKFHWIPNGFSRNEVSQIEGLDEEILQKIPKDKFIVGYTGSIGIANCLQNLLDAANELKDRDDYFFVIVGKGEYKSVLQQRIQEQKLNNVLILDPIPKTQIQSMLSLFDVCYIGLKDDPLFKYGVSPNKLFDYFYASKPIIYAIDSGNYKPVSDAGAGYEVKPESSAELVKAIQKIYSLEECERIELGINGRKYVEEWHDYGSLAKKMEEVLFS